MDEEFDPSLAPLPEGVLPDVYKVLKDLVDSDAQKAISYLKQDPLAVVALSKILKNIQEFETEEAGQFLASYEKSIRQLFSVDHLVNELGLGYTAELLLGYWRKLNQQTHIDSVTELILENLTQLKSKTTTLASTPSNRVVFEIINDGVTRVQSMYNHERTKAEDELSAITNLLDEFIANQFIPLPKSGIPNVWQSLLSLATMKHGTAIEFRKLMAQLLLKHLKEHFDEFIDDQKYSIAPYLALLEKIAK